MRPLCPLLRSSTPLSIGRSRGPALSSGGKGRFSPYSVSRASVVGRDLGHGTADAADGLGGARRRPRATSEAARWRVHARARARARGLAAQAGYIQARGHGSQCDAGCRSRWGCRVAYLVVCRALRALTLRRAAQHRRRCVRRRHRHSPSPRLTPSGSNARPSRSRTFAVRATTATLRRATREARGTGFSFFFSLPFFLSFLLSLSRGLTARHENVRSGSARVVAVYRLLGLERG